MFSLILVASIWNLANCQIYTGINSLELLIETESKFIQNFEQYLDEQEQSMRYLRKKILNYKVQHESLLENIESYLSNPLNSYLFLKRLTFDAENILKTASGPSAEFIRKFQNYQNESLVVPTNEDVTGAVLGLLRLQETYNLATNDLAQGAIYDVKYRHVLSTHDRYLVGKILNEEDEPEYASEWLQEALSSHHEYYDNLEITESEISQELNLSRKLAEEPKETPSDQELVYRKSCRNELQKFRNLLELSQLTCRFLKTTSKFTIIAPFKVEELNKNPEVLLFHEVLSDDEISTIKKLSRKLFETSGIENPEISKRQALSSRVSQVAWLDDWIDDRISRISRRVQDMTGLSTESAEPLQVQNYGIGGHYTLHVDYHFNKEKIRIRGARLATLLFYLSDVELGGATVFPYLKLYVTPKKGTVVFWYNLTKSGHGAWITQHASCPVIKGTKWAANKWLHEFHQEFRRPCSLNIEDSPENPHAYYNELLLTN